MFKILLKEEIKATETLGLQQVIVGAGRDQGGVVVFRI